MKSNIKSLSIISQLNSENENYVLFFQQLFENKLNQLDFPTKMYKSIFGKEFLFFTIYYSADYSVDCIIRKINDGVTNFYQIFKETNIIAEKQSKFPHNYISDLFYSTFFKNSFSKKIYEIKKIPGETNINILFSKILNRTIFIENNDLFFQKTNIKFNFNVCEVISSKKVIIMKSPFKTGYFDFYFQSEKNATNLINTFLLSSYYELLMRKEIQLGNLVYTVDSDVIFHSFGYLLKISFSGFKIESDELFNTVLTLINKKPKVSIEYIKNYTLFKLFRVIEYVPLRVEKYAESIVYDYNIDVLVKEIKNAKSIEFPDPKDMYGIYLN